MITLGEKGPHGIGVSSEQASIPPPQRCKGNTLKNKVPFIPNSTSVATRANPLSPVNMTRTSQTANSNRQTMTA